MCTDQTHTYGDKPSMLSQGFLQTASALPTVSQVCFLQCTSQAESDLPLYNHVPFGLRIATLDVQKCKSQVQNRSATSGLHHLCQLTTVFQGRLTVSMCLQVIRSAYLSSLACVVHVAFSSGHFGLRQLIT